MKQFEEVRDLLSNSNIKNAGLPKAETTFLKDLRKFVTDFLKNLYFDYDENTTEKYVNAIAAGCAMSPDDIVHMPRILVNIVTREKLVGDYMKYQEIVDFTTQFIDLVKSGKMSEFDTVTEESGRDVEILLS